MSARHERDDDLTEDVDLDDLDDTEDLDDQVDDPEFSDDADPEVGEFDGDQLELAERLYHFRPSRVTTTSTTHGTTTVMSVRN